MKRRLASILTVLLLILVVFLAWNRRPRRDAWAPAQIAVLESLWLGRLGPLPADPSNRVADDPRAVDLGHRLFFDPRLSWDGTVSCATCHRPELAFTDGLPRGKALGEVDRNTRSIVGSAYSPWLFWDGRKDSLWAQALDPLEHEAEHGGTRLQYAHVIAQNYREDYEDLFGPLPPAEDLDRLPDRAGPRGTPEDSARWGQIGEDDRIAVTRVFVNAAKAMAAYERKILPGPAPFDAYVQALLRGDDAAMGEALTDLQVDGLKLFLGPAGCIQCHHGPLFTNNEFHNVGAPGAQGAATFNGRIEAVQEVLFDPFNCTGPWSDAGGDCPDLRYLKVSGDELFGAVRTPSLRGVAQTAPYMSFGQLPSLAAVLDHYNQARDESPVGHSDLLPLGLEQPQLDALEAFLHSLSGPIAAPAQLLRPPPSVLAFLLDPQGLHPAVDGRPAHAESVGGLHGVALRRL